MKKHWLKHPHDPEWDVCPYCGIGVRRRVGDEEYSYTHCPWCGKEVDPGPIEEKETNNER